MSYAGLGQMASTRARRRATRTVGALAATDPVLARASLVASLIIKNAVMKPTSEQGAYIIREMNRIRTGLGVDFVAKLRQQRSRGETGMTATFNAIRLALANALTEDMLQYYRTVVAETQGAEVLGQTAPAHDYTAQDIGCGITGGVGVAANLIASIYGGGQPAGAAIGAGTGVLTQALDCGRRDREGALAVAQSNAQTAAANLAVAQTQAQAQLMLEQTRGARTERMLFIGGGALAVGLVAYMVLR